MAGVQLSVSPETLRATAMEMLSVLRNVRAHAGRIRDISARTRGYWQGDAGEEDRSGYRLYSQEAIDAARRLESRSVSLLKLSGLYQETEREAAEVNAALNVDSILSM